MSGSDEMPIEDKIAIERGHLRCNLRALSSQPDFVKHSSIGIHLNHSLYLGKFMPAEYSGRLLPLNDIFVAVYGPGGAGVYWHAECSIIRPLSDVCQLFWMTLDPPAERQAYNPSLMSAIFKARQMGETWIIAEDQAFAGVQHGWQIPAKRVQVDVEKAARWLLSKPPFKHLVPASLARAITSGSMQPATDPLTPDTIEGNLTKADIDLPQIKTGPRPTKREAVIGKMKRQIELGEMTLAELRGLKKKELPPLFGAAETTCHEARQAVLATTTNSD